MKFLNSISKYNKRRRKYKILLALLNNKNHKPDIRVEFPEPYIAVLPEGSTAKLLQDAIDCIYSEQGFPYFDFPKKKIK